MAGQALPRSLRLGASGDEAEYGREERLRLRSPLQRCPPRGHVAGADLAGLPGPVNRSPVEPLVCGEPGRCPVGPSDCPRCVRLVLQISDHGSPTTPNAWFPEPLYASGHIRILSRPQKYQV